MKLNQFQNSLESFKSFQFMPKMSTKDSIRMSFWQKFIKYRRFPFKFVTHLLLLVFVTVQVFLFASEREDYLFSAGGTIVNSFMPDGFEESKETANGYATFSFYKMDEVVEHIEETVNNVCCWYNRLLLIWRWWTNAKFVQKQSLHVFSTCILHFLFVHFCIFCILWVFGFERWLKLRACFACSADDCVMIVTTLLDGMCVCVMCNDDDWSHYVWTTKIEKQTNAQL